MVKHLAGIPVVRLSSRLQLASFFPPPSRGGRRGPAGSPPALMVDVKVIIRRHFPILPGNRIVEKVAEDIALRRQPSRKLRRPERVKRALATDVLPFVKHPFDRSAVVAGMEKICAYVSGACADPRLAKGGVQVLILLDTFARPTLLRRPPPCKPVPMIRPAKYIVARIKPCMDMDHGSTAVSTKKPRPVGVIGDGRPKPVDERLKGCCRGRILLAEYSTSFGAL